MPAVPRIPALVEELYAGCLDHAAWDRALIGIADMVGASGALLFAVDPSTATVLRAENHRFDPQVVDDYQRYWTFEDPRTEYFVSVPTGHPATERTLQIPGWPHTRFLNEFLLPADAPHYMPAWLRKSEHKCVTLSLQGTRRRGPFDAQDLENFRLVLPHVARAVEIRDRLEQSNVRADTLNATLDRATFGVMVLDAAGRILETNTAAQEFLRHNKGVRRNSDGTLYLRGPAGGELRRWITTGKAPADGDGLLHVPQPPSSPLSVLVTILPALTVSWMGGDPRWLVLIFDPERQIAVSVTLIEHDLRLSTREAEIAALLVSGFAVHQAAKRLKISEHTARTHLKSIFRKTGLHSQADLSRRVMGSGPGAIID
jgi:DNA-binding CsgD family transcriptional regulator